MKELKKAYIEAFKEMVRMIILAIIPVMLEGIDVKTGNIVINWSIILAISLVTALRAADRFLHVYETENKPELKGQSMGLVRL